MIWVKIVGRGLHGVVSEILEEGFSGQYGHSVA
jgi:hypothetical protein